MANIASPEKRQARLNKWLARREQLKEIMHTFCEPFMKELKQVNKNIWLARRDYKKTIVKWKYK